MNSKKQTLEEKLSALRLTYGKQLPQKLDEVNALWTELQNIKWDWNTAKNFHRHVHTLAGSAPTFGFTDVGQQARQIEQLAKQWFVDNTQPSTDECETVQSMLTALSSPKKSDENLSDSPATSEPAWVVRKPNVRLIYLLESDKETADDIAAQLSHFEYQVKIFSNSGNIDAAIKNECPAAIIANVSLPEGDLAGILLIRGVKAQYNANLPVIFISTQNDFESRLQAVRAGGDAYFIKPLEIAPLVDYLDKLTNNNITEPFRVLVVDDDNSLAMHYSLVLEQADMNVTILSEPKKIIPALAEVRPELILMDVYMPDCTGIELAKLIRQQDAYLSIPIVFISSETDLEKQFHALRMGGDDFLTKPVSDNRLIASAVTRADRSRTVNTLMAKDGLTGLLSHSKIKEQLAAEVSRSNRTDSPLSFAMIDIDLFKKVNDNYGHLMGDRVIKSLARLLQQRLRQSDSIGRYGGEEFAVVLPDCTLKQAEAIFEEIRKAFSSLHFLHGNSEIKVTISIGIADASHHKKPEDINHAADEALYSAKENGRNQVKLATSNTKK